MACSTAAIARTFGAAISHADRIESRARLPASRTLAAKFQGRRSSRMEAAQSQAPILVERNAAAAALERPPAPAAASAATPVHHVLQRLLAAARSPDAALWALAAVLGAAVVLGGAEPAAAASEAPHRAQAALGDLAENEEFWGNVGRYISYFFSVLLGTAYVAIKPVLEWLKRPSTAILVILGGGVLYLFVSTTVSAMLGVNDLQEYVPSSIVTPQL